MADVSEKRYSYCVQTDVQVVPTNPVFTRVAVVDNAATIKSTPVFKEASTRKDYGAPGDPSVTGKDVSGDFTIDFFPQWSGADDNLLLAGIYADDWVDIDSVQGHQAAIDGATYDHTTGILDLSTASGGQPDQLLDGQAVEIYGDPDVDGVYELTFVSANNWALSPAPPTTKTLIAGTLMISERARNKSTPKPFIWKDNQNDIGVSRYHLGCYCSNASWSFAIEDNVQHSITVTGASDNIITGGGGYTGETEVIPTAHPIVVTGDNTGQVVINGVNQVAGCAVSGLDFSFGRVVTAKKGVFVEGACGLSAGDVTIEGTLNVDFQNANYITWMFNNNPFGLFVVFPHSDDVGYAVSIPRCFLSDISETQNESQIIQDASFRGAHDDDLEFLIQYCRFRR